MDLRRMIRRLCRSIRWPAPLLAAAILAVSARSAEAHLVSTGLGPIYDGIAHFLLSPDDLISALALALLAGLSGAESSRRVALFLPAAWLVGGLAGLLLKLQTGPDLAWVPLLLLGLLVAADRRLPIGLIVAIGILLGLCRGLLNGATMGGASEGARALLGIAGTIFVLVTLVEAAIVRFRSPFVRIGVRVLGSWTAATGMLLLGWSLR